MYTIYILPRRSLGHPTFQSPRHLSWSFASDPHKLAIELPCPPLLDVLFCSAYHAGFIRGNSGRDNVSRSLVVNPTERGNPRIASMASPILGSLSNMDRLDARTTLLRQDYVAVRRAQRDRILASHSGSACLPQLPSLLSQVADC